MLGLFAAATLWLPQVGSAPLLDGRCPDKEWALASRADIGGGVQLLSMQTAKAVHLCMVLPAQSYGSYDLYLQGAGGELWNLHSSAQVGERRFNGESFGSFSFGNHAGWFSPPVPFMGLRTDEARDRTPVFAAVPSREIQIEKSRFGLEGAWRMMLDIRALGPGRAGTITFPEDAASTSPSSWAQAGRK